MDVFAPVEPAGPADSQFAAHLAYPTAEPIKKPTQTVFDPDFRWPTAQRLADPTPERDAMRDAARAKSVA